MDKENMSCFPHDFPFDFSDITGVTHRSPHSASFQQPLFSFKEKSYFSNSPDSALGWCSPLVNSDEDYWNLIYAAASEIARMKTMKMNHFPRQRGYSGDRRLVSCQSSPVGRTTVKRECAGTGVFLPRPPPESCKPHACSYANLPPRTIQSSNKSFVPVTTRTEVEAHYEMLISRRNALILAAQQQRRSSVNRSVIESPMNNNNPEVLLPQEWTY